MELDGLGVVPEAEVGVAEVAQIAALPSLVADLLRDREGLRVELDGLGVVPEAEVGEAEVAQTVALPSLVADLPRDREGLRVELDGLGVCLLYTSPSPRDGLLSRMPSSA